MTALALAVLAGVIGATFGVLAAERARQRAEERRVRDELRAFTRLCELILTSGDLDGAEELREQMQADYHRAQTMLRELDS